MTRRLVKPHRAIAAVAAPLAYVLAPVPVVGEVVAGVALTAGAIATEQDIAQRNLVSAVIDAASTLLGGGSLAENRLGTLLEEAARSKTMVVPIAEWLSEDADTAKKLSSFLDANSALISSGGFGVTELLKLISGRSPSNPCPTK